MGGPGSGNWYRWDTRSTTGDYHRIDVRGLYRKGYLIPRVSGTTRWWREERQSGSIGWSNEGEDWLPSALILSYRVNNEDLSYRVPLTWTPCNYGGQRPWFRCPGEGCGRRVAVLFGGKYFLCRHCHNLAYETTREAAHNRSLRAAQKIRLRLGGSASIYEPFPPKPKGMHWRTYWRLMRAEASAEQASWLGLVAWMDKSNARVERLLKG